MFRARVMEHAARATKRVQTHPGIKTSEAQTKNTLIEPFLQCLGYDTAHPSQVTLEVPTELGGKIDYVLTGQGNAKVAVEAKKAGVKLSKKETNQLRSYFTFSEAVAAILTNGIDVWLFTDLDKANVMDAEPYLTVDIRHVTDNDIHHLQTLTRMQVNPTAIHEQAQRERYRTQVNTIVAEELAAPSQEFLRLVGKKVGIKPLTKAHLKLLRPLITEALKRARGPLRHDPPPPKTPPPPPKTTPPPKNNDPRRPTLASLFGKPLPARNYRQILISVVQEMQTRYPSVFAETVSRAPFVKPNRTWQYISSDAQDLSPKHQPRKVGAYFLDVNLSAKKAVARARQFLVAFGHSANELSIHRQPGPPKLKGASLFGKPIPAKTYIEMLTSVVAELQNRHLDTFSMIVGNEKVFRGTKRWIISRDPDDLGTLSTKSTRQVGDYWIYTGGTGRVPRAHKFLKAFGHDPKELVVHTSDE